MNITLRPRKKEKNQFYGAMSCKVTLLLDDVMPISWCTAHVSRHWRRVCVCFLEWDMAKEWLTPVKLPVKSGVCIKEGAVPYRVISSFQHSAAVISILDCSWPTSSAFFYPQAKRNATRWVTGSFIITRTSFCVRINYIGLQPRSSAWFAIIYISL